MEITTKTFQGAHSASHTDLQIQSPEIIWWSWDPVVILWSTDRCDKLKTVINWSGQLRIGSDQLEHLWPNVISFWPTDCLINFDHLEISMIIRTWSYQWFWSTTFVHSEITLSIVLLCLCLCILQMAKCKNKSVELGDQLGDHLKHVPWLLLNIDFCLTNVILITDL